MLAAILMGCSEEKRVPVETDYDQLVRIARRQEVEIAIIEQAVILKELKAGFAKAEVPKELE